MQMEIFKQQIDSALPMY